MKKQFIGIGIIILFLTIGLSGCIDNNPKTEEITLPPSSNQLLVGNQSYPGFYAWVYEFKEGDRVELTVQASSSVNLIVIPKSPHEAWVDSYNNTQNPGLQYPYEASLKQSNQTLSTVLVFTVPYDGEYVLVAFNTFSYYSTVNISGKIHRNA